MRLVFFAAACTVCLLCLSVQDVARSQEKKPETRGIDVSVKSADARPVSITLYREGKAIATRDVPHQGTHQFTKLPRGTYELHFEAPDFVTVIRKAIVED